MIAETNSSNSFRGPVAGLQVLPCEAERFSTALELTVAVMLLCLLYSQHATIKTRLLSPSWIIITNAGARQFLSSNGVVGQSLGGRDLGGPVRQHFHSIVDNGLLAHELRQLLKPASILSINLHS